MKNLSDKSQTTLVLISSPEVSPLKEAERAAVELREIGVENQILIINGLLDSADDNLSKAICKKQNIALESIPEMFNYIKKYKIPLRPYNITGLENVRMFLKNGNIKYSEEKLEIEGIKKLNDVVEDIYMNDKKVVFAMGKGGVGKTTIAASIALGLAQKGKKVHLTTTDPAAHLKFVIDGVENITMSSIDEKKELENYKEDVLSKARNTLSDADIDYIKEDLRSPCTQEIAVFRLFARLVEKSENEVVVIDTAPTGHTLLLLDSTQSYHKEIQRSQGDIPESVKKLLPKLRNSKETEVVIVTLAEATPVHEARRLEKDLERANIFSKWWIINSSFYASNTTNSILRVKASNEVQWINKINELSNKNFAVIEWIPEDLKGDTLNKLLQ